MRKIVLSICAVLAVCASALAQDLRITGTVATNEGVAAVGATVSVVGTTDATITDINGDYVIMAPADATLSFSYVGMKTVDTKVNGRTKIDVVFDADATQIEELIVVAYGTAKKESFTGSASSVSSEDLAKKQVSTVTQALAGVVPGIQATTSSGQPGSGATIYVRGVGSINGTKTPLYIVDGMPYDGSIASINPADIESVSVLKDAVSTSLYGSRASNGVIVITTKGGKKGKSKVLMFLLNATLSIISAVIVFIVFSFAYITTGLFDESISTFGIFLHISQSISRRVSSENIYFLSLFLKRQTVTSSKREEARFIMSR